MANTLKQDLIKLRKLKRDAEAKGRVQKAANVEFKQHQAKVYQRMWDDDPDERVESMKVGGTLFSLVEKIKGSVDDRTRYVRWALENDEAIQDFVEDTLWHFASYAEERKTFEEKTLPAFYDAITSTELIEYKEKSDKLNQLVSQAVDDEQILPPGTNFRPDDYISQRAS